MPSLDPRGNVLIELGALATKVGSSNIVSPAERVLAPLEPWHIVGDPGEPAFQNGWVRQPNGNPVAFTRDQRGVVHLSGACDSLSATGEDIFTLPVGYRPIDPQIVACQRRMVISEIYSDGNELRIGTDGTITVPDLPRYVVLSAIQFRAFVP